MRHSVEILDEVVKARVAYNVRRFREAQGLSVDDAAKLTGMTSPEWQAIERGDLDTDMSTLARVAVAVDVDPGELLNPVPDMAQGIAASPGGAGRGRTGKEGA